MGDAVEIRAAVESDAEAVAEVLRRAFAEFEARYTRAAFAATTPGAEQVVARMREGPVWVAVADGRVVGTIAAVLRPGGCYVRGMGVCPEARVGGAGGALLRTAERFAEEAGAHRVFLSTTPFLDRAIELYTRRGFRRVDEGPHSLEGTPLFTMAKSLDGGRR